MSAPSYAELDKAISEAKSRAVRTLPDQGDASFLSRYYILEGQQAIGNSKTNESGNRTDLYEVQLKYQVGFSPQHNSDDNELLSSLSTSASKVVERSPIIHAHSEQQGNGKIQQPFA